MSPPDDIFAPYNTPTGNLINLSTFGIGDQNAAATGSAGTRATPAKRLRMKLHTPPIDEAALRAMKAGQAKPR